ncbi:hypothetical protein [Vibrio ulleungensis]|uniref:Uncharacterized protein n=1 Tax=Vibrio ulleungensis TaxID=2807619 RepID=A0ABS2HRC2_9VIBR|nr:hypothetical protein [Vibrio ulleungensis]MBM7038431.1 hypothetical protein [Vibrio ulleungensis]
MKIVLTVLVIVAVLVLIVLNNDNALAMVCSTFDVVQEQYPVECSKARVISAF